MAELPSGIVTFLFTDIEGSTRLIEEVGEARYEDLLRQHRADLRDAFSRHGGVEVDTQGDAFFFVFEDPDAALRAARDAQAALADGPVAVRMGAHTGEARRGERGYVGREVHRAARIAAAGHGRQVLLSATTAAIAGRELTELGEHRLKDFDEPIALFQLGADEFPPLKTISNTNLPRPASSFVGRTEEVADITALLRNGSRFVTLTGPGGSGKTRLAIEAAAEVISDFRAGVFWVGLASLRDPSLVLETVAQTLGAKEDLAVHIGERELLLLLDNLEQVSDAAPGLAELVEACPNVRLLVTSRELLRVRGEVEYEVLPLTEPDAVELFCDRACVDPTPAVEELCRQLDNLPLAVELAAARAKVLAPNQILERLSQRLDLLKGGRDADPRQQTLRATIAWSYDLLNSEEQRLFAQLGAFAGGCAFEAAEAVCTADVDTLQSLVDKSLLRSTEDRFWMLETIREYAQERLEELPDDAELHRRHAEYFSALVEGIETRGDELLGNIAQLEREHDNFRATLTWALSAGEPGVALRLAARLGHFWWWRGHTREGLRWLEAALAAGVDEAPEFRAHAYYEASHLSLVTGAYEAAQSFAEQSLALAEAAGEGEAALRALRAVVFASIELDDGERAAAAAQRALALSRQRKDKLAQAASLFAYGHALLGLGESGRAVDLLREALALNRELEGSRGRESTVLLTLALVCVELGRTGEAIAYLRNGLPIVREFADAESCQLALDATASAIARRKPARAARLAGAAASVLEEAGLSRGRVEQRWYERTLETLHGRLGRDRVAELLAEGRTLTPEMALEGAFQAID